MTNRKLTALAALGLALSAVAGAVALANLTAPHRGASAAIAAGTVAALFGVGIYAWNRGGANRFGQVLVLTGICWFLATLSNSDVSLLYSLGRIAVWVFEALLVYALLSYPTGRLEARPERLLVGFAALLVAVLYLPTVPLVEQFPLPTPYAACVEQCPGNAFFLAGSEPEFVDSLLRPPRELLTLLLYLSVAALLAMRLRTAARSLRRTLTPVLTGAVLRFAAAALYVGMRRGGAGEEALQVVALVTLLTLPAIALGFLVGLVQWRVFSAGALSSLTTGLEEATDPGQLRALLAHSLEEPSLEVFYALPPGEAAAGEEGWHDSSGRPSPPPRETAGRCLVEVDGGSGLRAVITCDEGFRDHPDFLRAVASCVLSGLERQRLNVALAASLEDVAASRKRLAAAADSARQKIERDLHDGAQQQLVTLRVKLELAREALERDSSGAAEMVAGLGPEVEEIIEEVRSLARGIYPPLLASSGLGEALRAAARRASLPVSVDADDGRYPEEVESAVYFCCLEALQNAAKHADGATRVSVALREQGELRFEVSDDGCGFDPGAEPEGSGLTGMSDRLAVVDGELRVESAPGSGTRVLGSVPLG